MDGYWDYLKNDWAPVFMFGDWQVTPDVVIGSGWPRAIGAAVVAPSAATNLVTKRCIDYAVMSKELAPLVETVEVMYGARCSPHAPVKIVMRCPRALGTATRLARPRTYIAEKPPAEARVPIYVEWGQ